MVVDAPRVGKEQRSRKVPREGRDVVTDELAARKAWLDDRLSELTSDERDTLRQVVAIMNKMINSTDN